MAFSGGSRSVRPLALVASAVLVGGLALTVGPEASAVGGCGLWRSFRFGSAQACVHGDINGTINTRGDFRRNAVRGSCTVYVELYDVRNRKVLSTRAFGCRGNPGRQLVTGPSRVRADGRFQARVRVNGEPPALSPAVDFCGTCD